MRAGVDLVTGRLSAFLLHLQRVSAPLTLAGHRLCMRCSALFEAVLRLLALKNLRFAFGVERAHLRACLRQQG